MLETFLYLCIIYFLSVKFTYYTLIKMIETNTCLRICIDDLYTKRDI